MNRAERRREDRTNNKLAKWLKSLDRDQRNLLSDYCKERSKDDLVGYFNAYERVLRPVLFEVTNDTAETEKILERIIYEVGLEGINLHRFENGSVEYMTKIKESREEIIKNYEQMRAAGIQEKDIQNGLKTLFPKFTANAIKNVIVEYKRDLRKDSAAEINSTDEAVNYIFSKEVKKTQNKAHTEEKEASKESIPKIENKDTEKLIEGKNEQIKDMFEVIEQKVTLKGKYGTYTKDKNGVQAGQVFFEDDTSIDKYVQTEVAKQRQAAEEEVVKLQEQIDELYKNLDKEIEEFKLKTDEIKAVFSYM